MTIRKKAVDAVIIGYGWTGAIMAKTLTDAGLKTVALERGPARDTSPDFEYPRIADELRYGIRGDLWQPLARETVTTATPGQDRINGTGDLLFSAFLSPSHSNGWIWGVGPAIQAPTHSDIRLGNNNWGLGPTFVVLHLEKSSPWLYGVLVNDVWSVGRSGSHTYNNGLIEPFANYNLPNGGYLTSSPILTVNCDPRGEKKWTVPVGGGAGKIIHVGRLPVNLQVQAFRYVTDPTYGPNWEVRTQVQLLFPK